MPSAVIGALRVNLSADTAAFSAGLAKAQGDASKFQKGLASTLGKIGPMLGVSLGVGAFAGFLSSARAAIGAVGDLADAAVKAGASAEKLQVLREALETSGGAAGDADAALQALNVRLGQFLNTGTGPAVEALKQLGIAYSDIAGKSADVRFDTIASALSKVTDDAERAAIAAGLFGKAAGPAMAAALAPGQRSLAETEKAMRSLGRVMSNEMVAKGDELDDKFKIWASTIDTWFKKAVIWGAEGTSKLFGQDNPEGLRTRQELLEEIAKTEEKMNVARGGALAGLAGRLELLKRELNELDERANKYAIMPSGLPQAYTPLGPEKEKKKDTSLDDLREEQARRLEAVTAALMTETEAENAAYAERMTNLNDFLKNKQISQDEYNELSERSEADHAAKLKAIDDQRHAAEKQATLNRVAFYLGAASAISDSLGTLFGDSKEFAYASAVLNVAEGITKALSLPFPMNWVQSAAVAAAGAAQIATIARTNLGSGGGAPSVGGAGGGAAAAAAQAPPQQSLYFTINGSQVGKQQVYDLITQINAAIRDDNVKLIVAPHG